MFSGKKEKTQGPSRWTLNLPHVFGLNQELIMGKNNLSANNDFEVKICKYNIIVAKKTAM